MGGRLILFKKEEELWGWVSFIEEEVFEMGFKGWVKYLVD